VTVTAGDAVLDWLLEPKNPTARWLTLRLLLEHADDDPDVIEAQRSVPDSAWAQAILAGQRRDGSWKRGNTYIATFERLSALAGLGMPADHPSVSAACNLFLDRLELPGEGFALKTTNPRGPHECRNGRVLFVLNQFGYGRDKRVKAAADWLLANQMLDGGWNCAHRPKGRIQADGVIRMDHECSLDQPNHKSSLFSTMAVLKGLASTSRPPKRAVSRGVDFLLQHRIHRARKSGRALYGWPPKLEFLGGGYDGLQPLRVLAMAGARPDERMDEALSYLKSRAVDGRWPADNTQTPGRPNKWVTVHALHVLRVLQPTPP
jgi:hypothetical protein